MMFINQIQTKYSYKLSFLSVFNSKTISEIISKITCIVDKPRIYLDSDTIVSNMQCSMLSIESRIKKPIYNCVSCIKIKNSFDIDKLENSIHKIIQTHDILRTTFIMKDDWRQLINIVYDKKKIIEKIYDDDIENRAKIEYKKSKFHNFDLTNGPLIQIKFIISKYVIVVTNFHHTVTDTHTSQLFLHYLDQLYNGLNQLPHLRNQYIKYSSFNNTINFDSTIAIKKIDLPYDFPKKERVTYIGDIYSFQIDNLDEIKKFCSLHNVSLHLFFITCFCKMFFEYSNKVQVIIPLSFRNDFTENIGLMWEPGLIFNTNSLNRLI